MNPARFLQVLGAVALLAASAALAAYTQPATAPQAQAAMPEPAPAATAPTLSPSEPLFGAPAEPQPLFGQPLEPASPVVVPCRAEPYAYGRVVGHVQVDGRALVVIDPSWTEHRCERIIVDPPCLAEPWGCAPIVVDPPCAADGTPCLRVVPSDR